MSGGEITHTICAADRERNATLRRHGETHAREAYEPINTNPNAPSTDPTIGRGKRAWSCESTGRGDIRADEAWGVSSVSSGRV